MDFLSTRNGTLLEHFYPEGWDFARIDACCSHPPQAAAERQPHWHAEFSPQPCDTLEEFNVKMGHEIAREIRGAHAAGRPLVLILPAGPMGMYRWAVYFLTEWQVPCAHLHCFNMDEWADAEGNTLPPAHTGSFRYAMENAFYNPLGALTVPPAQRNFATRENLPEYAGKIAALKAQGARMVTIYGIGRMCHIAFWEPQYGGEFASEEEWKRQTHRIGAKLHPLTIEQNALTSFKSRTPLIPCTANTIGPGIFLQSDRMIGGADGVLGRGMQWQGMSFWMTLRYGPSRWVPSSHVPTLPGRLFFLRELAGPLVPDCN